MNTIALELQMRLGGNSWNGGGWGWGFGFLWPLLWLLVLIASIGIIVHLLTRHNDDSTNGDQALEVLRRRYARGEIEEDEFEERASRLRNPP